MKLTADQSEIVRALANSSAGAFKQARGFVTTEGVEYAQAIAKTHRHDAKVVAIGFHIQNLAKGINL